MRTDYHVHTPLCGHAVGLPREYILAAQKASLEEIGFSDHNPMPTQFDDWRMAPDKLPEYLEMIAEARLEFPHYPIRLGLECDFIPGYEEHLRTLAAAADWDYLIGSVHYATPGWDIDNPKHLQRWSEHPVEEIWTAYFTAYTKMAESCLFDFLAHPDLVKKFGHRPEGDLSRFYHEALDAIAEAGITLEVSTAGLRKDVHEIYPSRDFLVAAHARHIPIVINSDAHAPEEVAYEFGQAYDLVREVGYTEVMRFSKRKASPVEIG
ncbi:MAG TPA: histidinol-phosphatase HisJ family protein [Candidatus Methylacidiphilales bacterium]|nr:histidinol-phosphatase HisJ family protein [Candidatus Methylacidiphilales bacterium]